MAKSETKPDRVLFGEIEKRVASLSPEGLKTLHHVLAERVPWSDVGAIQQIVQRHADLTDAGRDYINRSLGVVVEEAAD